MNADLKIIANCESRGAVDANELTEELHVRRDDCMNSLRLTRKIQIERTRDDPRVISTCRVQADKVLAIESQDNPILRASEIEDGFVRQGLPGLPRVVHGHDVMPESTQFLDNRQRKVLVGEQPCHGLGCLVLANLRLNLVSMRTHIRPGVRQILGAQCGIGPQQIRLTRPQSSGLL